MSLTLPPSLYFRNFGRTSRTLLLDAADENNRAVNYATDKVWYANWHNDIKARHEKAREHFVNAYSLDSEEPDDDDSQQGKVAVPEVPAPTLASTNATDSVEAISIDKIAYGFSTPSQATTRPIVYRHCYPDRSHGDAIG